MRWLILSALLLTAVGASAQTQYFVSTTGNDANSGTSSRTPWKTIGHAISALNPAGGYVVNVSPGTYTENFNIPLAKSGPSTAQRGVFKCTQQWSVPTGNGCRLRGTGSTDTPYSINANNIDFGAVSQFGFDISNSATLSYGITLPCNIPTGSTGKCSTGNSVHILGNYIHDLSTTVNPCEVNPNGHPAISFNNHHGPYMADAQFIGNRITNIGNQSLSKLNGGPGCFNYYAVYMETMQAIMENNVIANIAGYGLHYYSSPCQGIISNNTITRTEKTNIIAGGGDCNNGVASGSLTISNNILDTASNGEANLTVGVPGGSGIGSSTHPILVSNNIFFGGAGGQIQIISPNSTTVSGSKTESPTTTFVSYTGGNNDNFNLKSGSVAVGGGTTNCVGGGQTPCVNGVDFVGAARPAPPSIGAYDVVGGGGTGVATLTPSPVAYAATNTGSCAASKSVTVTNTGAATLSLNGNSTITPNQADFQFTSPVGTCSTFTSLAPGVSCTTNMAFCPSATGARNAQFNMTTTANNPSAALTGTGTTPIVSLSPSSLAFSNQQLGTTSAVMTVTVTNTGTGALTNIVVTLQ